MAKVKIQQHFCAFRAYVRDKVGEAGNLRYNNEIVKQ